MYTCVCRKVWYSMVYIVLAALAVTPTLQFSVAGVSLSGLVYTAQCHVVTWDIHKTRLITYVAN